jgi:hypothetical protein
MYTLNFLSLCALIKALKLLFPKLDLFLKHQIGPLVSLSYCVSFVIDF